MEAKLYQAGMAQTLDLTRSWVHFCAMRTMNLALACCLLAAIAARAQPAVVEAVQYPAWLERGGNAVPLMPGMPLEARDRLRTGGNARVQLKLAEGSAVKLGENAQFVIERAEDRGVFRATLAVVAGAFRFTTRALGGRDVAIKVKHVTVGIRGTDLWGKSTDERDLVVLIEGKITVGAQGHPPVALERPLDLYQKPRDAAPEVTRIDPRQLEEWARETELSADGAAARAGGRWRMVAAVKPRRDDALALRRALRAAGYPAEVVAKEGYFLVQVTGLAGESEARALMAGLRGVRGVELPTVHEGP
jgi:hypothetical protein